MKFKTINHRSRANLVQLRGDVCHESYSGLLHEAPAQPPNRTMLVVIRWLHVGGDGLAVIRVRMLTIFEMCRFDILCPALIAKTRSPRILFVLILIFCLVNAAPRTQAKESAKVKDLKGTPCVSQSHMAILSYLNAACFRLGIWIKFGSFCAFVFAHVLIVCSCNCLQV